MIKNSKNIIEVLALILSANIRYNIFVKIITENKIITKLINNNKLKSVQIVPKNGKNENTLLKNNSIIHTSKITNTIL